MLLLSNDISGSPPRDSRDVQNKEIVGQATNIITSKMLKGHIESNKNCVFSPIGYASILAMLGEGAQQNTNDDINTVLKHPQNRDLVRSAYRTVLSHLQGHDPQTAPQFRSWFYIYKNNTIDESYRQILFNDYYVTVKNVEPYNPDEEESAELTTHRIEKTTDESTSTNDTENEATVNPDEMPTNSKDIVEFDTFKMDGGPTDETRIDTQDDASKFDEVIEDRQYVEVPLIKDEMNKATIEVNENKLKTVKERKEGKKAPLPIKYYEEMEIMQAAESRLGKIVSNLI